MMKLSGLMDQTACAIGSIIGIDFYEREKPDIKKINYEILENGLSIIAVNTGESHEKLNSHYASIPWEMKKVAGFFDKDALREIRQKNIIGKVSLKIGNKREKILKFNR